MINWILIFIFTVIPVGLIMFLISSFNKKEKYSPMMLILLFLGGLLSYVLVKTISNLLNGHVYELSSASPFLKHDWEFFLVSFGLIAVVEELSKFIIVNVFCFKSKKFQYPYDGIMYAVTVSLGFAFVENLFYLNRLGLGVALSRAIFTIPAHAAFGVLMGYYLGLAKAISKKGMKADCTKMRYTAFFVPLLLHGLYDYVCNFNVEWSAYVLIAYTMFFYALAIFRIKKLNEIDFNINSTDAYTKDDIIIEYKDNISEQSDNIRQKLFEQQDEATWDNGVNHYTSNKFRMGMFAEDDNEESNHDR